MIYALAWFGGMSLLGLAGVGVIGLVGLLAIALED